MQQINIYCKHLEVYPEAEQQSVLILNDRCGAFSIATAKTYQFQQLQMMSDSWLAHQALLHNLKNNEIQENSMKLLNSLQEADGLLDLVIIKTPNNVGITRGTTLPNSSKFA